MTKKNKNEVDLNVWKDKVLGLFSSAEKELKKTTEIGKKMISASQTNTKILSCYQRLGKLTAKSIKSGKLKWENEEVDEILSEIAQLKEDKSNVESEVDDLKKS